MDRDHRWITAWLFVGVVMVFIQILLGGITRLTGSGLSITKWDIVTGTVPPLNNEQWNQAFELYKATPQYQKINEGISLKRFKNIYFWEYFHRLWARSMGFVFLVPFCVFMFRKSLSRATIGRLLIVISIAGLAAVFGWIMVASGLINRPWVNAYNLTIHLSLGISLLVSIFYAWLMERQYSVIEVSVKTRKWLDSLFFLVICQVILGGTVSGMKSALNFPTWPKMQGAWIPDSLQHFSNWNTHNLLFYDHSDFVPALVQFLHRNTAYLILLNLVFVFYLWMKDNKGIPNEFVYVLLGIIVVQMSLGILTLIGSIGSIPVVLGSMHQGMGIILLTYLFFLYKRTKAIN